MIKSWPFPQLGLLQQISLIFCILGIIVGSILVFTVNIYEKKYSELQLIEQNERVLSFLSAGSLDAIISEDRPVLETLVDQVLSTDPDISKIILHNEEGKILVEKGNSKNQTVQESISFSQDVILNGETFGSIELHWKQPSFSNKITEQTKPFLILTALLVLVLT